MHPSIQAPGKGAPVSASGPQTWVFPNARTLPGPHSLDSAGQMELETCRGSWESHTHTPPTGTPVRVMPAP